MKNLLHKIQGLLSLFVLAGLVFISACEDDDNDSGVVVVESFGPAGVVHGDEIVFIGRNLNKVTSVVLEPGLEIPSSQFKEVSSGSFKLVVPHAAKAGRVKVNHPGGTIETKTVLDFLVDVVITGVPVEAKPGTNITITGEKLNWIESITFPADLVVEKDDFVSVSQTELVVTVPMEAQTGYLKFAASGTKPVTFSSEEQLIVTLPVVTSIAPLSLKHTDILTINGSALDLVTQITFSGGAVVANTAFAAQSESMIQVAVPATSVKGKLTLKAPSGLTVQTANEITIILPNVTAFTPSNTDLHVAGAELTMTGTNLDLVKSVKFPGADAVSAFVSQSPTQIKVTIPAGAHGGSVSLNTIHDYVVPVSIPFGDQLTLTLVLYDDVVKNGFQQWGGWGATTVWNSTEQIRLGSTAIKVTYTGDLNSGGAQFGNGNVSTSGTAVFAFSVYGGPGTGGKKIQLLIKHSGCQSTKQVAINEGSWSDVQIPLSELGNAANITELFFQNVDFTGVVYIDHVGLK